MSKRRAWSRDELILAINVYFNLEGFIPDIKDPRIAALAVDLADLALVETDNESNAGRDKAAIIFKLSNLRSIDPAAAKKGLKGFTNVGKLDREVWEEFVADKKWLAQEVERIKESIQLVRETSEPLKANIHLLRLVGDELIGSLPLAIFELVKNAYDADAEEVSITLNLDKNEPYITIKDDGCGMDIDTIRRGWLQLGGPLKRENRTARTKKFHRLPLGEKGIGRLAAFKLGNRLSLITRPEQENKEYLVTIDLAGLLGEPLPADTSIEDVRVKVQSRIPTNFMDGSHGTIIRVDSLRQQEHTWDRRQVRRLYRMITTLVNPFTESDHVKESGGFKPSLSVPGHSDWIENLLDLKDIIGRATYRFNFAIDQNAVFTWNYEFFPPHQLKALRPNSSCGNEPLDLFPTGSGKKITLHPSQLEGIGPIKGEFHIFDRRSEILKLWGGETNQVKSFLDEQGGVRVYRNDIRVYTYGEPEDDWLGLNAARVNKPGKRLSTNSVIGGIILTDEKSYGLKEKTNREGFDQNICYDDFRNITASIVDFLNETRQSDRIRLDDAIKPAAVGVSDPTAKFHENIKALETIADKKGLAKEFTPRLQQIVKDYRTMQEAALGAAAGLNLAIIFHETERGIRGLVENIKKGVRIEILKQQASDLEQMLAGLSSLLKQDKPRKISARQILENVYNITKERFVAHKVVFSCPVFTGEDDDFRFFGEYNHYLSAIYNLLDNAIFWVRREKEVRGEAYHAAISVRTLTDWDDGGPCIAIIDNGSGFAIDPVIAQQPFVTKKRGGMGLGLYFAKMVMETQGGRVIIPADPSELDLDSSLGGAAVLMQFKKIQ